MGGLDSNTKLLLHCNSHDFEDTPKPEYPKATMHIDSAVANFNTCSFLFDGDSDYIQLAASTDWYVVGSNADNWTIEFWVRFSTNVTANETLVIHDDGIGNDCWYIQHLGAAGTGFRFHMTSDGASITASEGSNNIAIDTWYHIAFCKVANEYGIYKDGAQIAYDSTNDVMAAYPGNVLRIGSYPGGSAYLDGYMDDIHITQSNKYTAAPNNNGTTGDDTIIIPTIALTADANTKLLLQADEKYDASDVLNPGGAHNPTWVGNSTGTRVGTKYFGSASLYFDGTGDYITFPNSADWDFVGASDEDWTIDFWVKFGDHVGDETLCAQYEDGSNYWKIKHVHGTGWIFQASGAGGGGADFILTTEAGSPSGGEISDTSWHHVAVIHIDDDVGIYVDGTQYCHSIADASSDTFTGVLSIGAIAGVNAFYGYIDEFRIQNSNYFTATPNATPDDTITVPTGPYTTAQAGNQAIILG